MKKAIDKKELFETTPVPRAVASMAIPTAMTSLVGIFYGLVDTYFVGMLNMPVENAAVALAAPVMLAFNAVNNLFGVGTSSLMSRSLGARQYDKVLRCSAIGFYCALFFSLLFTFFCTLFRTPMLRILGADESTWEATSRYLFWTVTLGAVPAILSVVFSYFFRAEGAAVHASIGTMSGCLINILLDPIFILPRGLNMGAAGAGCATCIANICSLIYFLVLITAKRGKTYVCIHPKKFSFDRSILRGIFAVGIPASIQNLLNVTGMTILNSTAAGFGAEAIAAMGITQRIYTIPNTISMSMPQGVVPLISYNYASGNGKRLKKVVFFVMRIMAVLLLTMASAMILFPEFFISIFIEDSRIIEIGAKLLKRFSLGVPFLAMDFATVAIMQAVGKGTTTLVFAVLRKIAFEIPAIYILNYFIPLYGLASAQMAAEMLMVIITSLTLRRLFKELDQREKDFNV